MNLTQITDRKKLAAYFKKDPATHLYSLGDLDDVFWPNTTFYGEDLGEEVSRVTLLYRGTGLPVLLALGSEGLFGSEYARFLSPLLPDPVYAHLAPGLEDFFCADYDITAVGDHYKMSLVEPKALRGAEAEGVFRMNASHLPELTELYGGYPGNAFDPVMLSTGKYFGVRKQGVLVSVAGVHVFSSRFRVAALGNITTHPAYRNQGFARLVTTCLCQELLDEVEIIGLNVKADNAPAIHLYQSLGFKISSKYGEFELKKQL